MIYFFDDYTTYVSRLGALLHRKPQVKIYALKALKGKHKYSITLEENRLYIRAYERTE